ncbi:type IV secretion system protein VirB2 [Aminobacter lissarensis]|uniref:Type IV secretion system protein VirB2 n=1 Tax=Aminobacter carboxidus TaxID=376165 RepID=A0A8E1WKB8_9HYPH|nr:TrbC/VirB2 family protein [Aminobacter lissarensis]MBB6469484.1 type IV secretion system protein VirB2 [Aminobacter lissarensis]
MRPSISSSATAGLVALVVCTALAAPALASGGGGLPWEGPLQQVQQSITGPVAGFIALAAVAIAGGMLIFGGELNDFARRLMYVVLVAGILLGATQIVGLFGASGASIGDVAGEAPRARAGSTIDG